MCRLARSCATTATLLLLLLLQPSAAASKASHCHAVDPSSLSKVGAFHGPPPVALLRAGRFSTASFRPYDAAAIAAETTQQRRWNRHRYDRWSSSSSSSSFSLVSVPTDARIRTGPNEFATRAASSGNADDNENENENDGKKKSDLVETRVKHIMAEYRVSSLLYLGNACFVALGKIFSTAPMAAYAAAGPLMASATAHILRGAARHGRLGSDTYKRLNLFLAYFSVCGVLSFLIRPGIGFVPFGLPYLVGIKPSLKGYRYGVKGVDKGGEAKIALDFVDGLKSTARGVLSIKNANAGVYLAATLFVASSKTMKLLDLVNVVRARETGLVVAGRLLRYAKLSLLTGIVYTLKDAADRGRLDGTTFVQLNFLSSIVLGTQFAYLIQGGEITALAKAVAAFSAFFAYNGAASEFKKKQEAK